MTDGARSPLVAYTLSLTLSQYSSLSSLADDTRLSMTTSWTDDTGNLETDIDPVFQSASRASLMYTEGRLHPLRCGRTQDVKLLSEYKRETRLVTALVVTALERYLTDVGVMTSDDLTLENTTKELICSKVVLDLALRTKEDPVVTLIKAFAPSRLETCCVVTPSFTADESPPRQCVEITYRPH